MEGLTVSAAMGENNDAAAQVDLTVFNIKYAMGPITVGYQANESIQVLHLQMKTLQHMVSHIR